MIGGGRIAATQAMAARLTDWGGCGRVLSSDPSKAAARAEWRLEPSRSYTALDSLLAGEAARPDGMDAVMIASPNDRHFAAAKACLNAGIDVLCEKPLTNSLAEAREIVSAAQGCGRVFGVCYVMSCFAMVRQARAFVSAGGIGRVNQIHVEFMQDWMTPEDSGDAPHVKWRLDPKVSGPTSCTGAIVSSRYSVSMSRSRHCCILPTPTICV